MLERISDRTATMNEAHLHLLITHLPVLGVGFGTLLLAFGTVRDNRMMQRTALGVLLLAGLAAGAAYLTGEGAEEAIEGTIAGIDPYIEQHEEAGVVGLVAAGLAGAMALVVLASSRKGRALSRALVVLNLVFGLAAGLIGAFGLTRLLRGFLYRVSPIDPMAFLVGLLVVVVAVLVAALRPAGRAARVDPMTSMRTEH